MDASGRTMSSRLNDACVHVVLLGTRRYDIYNNFYTSQRYEIDCNTVQLDLGYPATSYPDISIIRLRSCNVYCLFFIYFHIKSCSKQISVLFHSMSILYEWLCVTNIIAMSAVYIITCINPTELAVFEHITPISGQIAYPDRCRSRHGRITEVGLYKTCMKHSGIL